LEKDREEGKRRERNQRKTIRPEFQKPVPPIRQLQVAKTLAAKQQCPYIESRFPLATSERFKGYSDITANNCYRRTLNIRR
jgi:hypothetical protein